MRFSKQLFAIVATFLFFTYSQDAYSQVYHVETLTVKDGLISNHVNHFDQDTLGYLWVSTTSGVCRYDGINWEKHTNVPGMPNNTGTTVKIVNNIPLICGVANEQFFSARYFFEGKWKGFAIPDSLETNEKKHWTAIKNQRLFNYYVVIKDTLHEFNANTKTWKKYTTPSSINKISKLKPFNNTLYLLSDNDLYKFQNGIWISLGQRIKNGEKEIFTKGGLEDVAFINDSLIYFTGNNWLGKLASDNFYVTYSDQDVKTKLKEIKIHPKGFIFFRSSQKYFWHHLSTAETQSFLTDNEDVHAVLTRMFIDKMGTLWISSYRGLHYISNFVFLNYTQNDGLPKSEVTLVTFLKNNKVLLGGVNGYSIMQNGKIIFKKDFTSLKVSNVRFMGADTLDGYTYVIAQDLGIGKVNDNTGEIAWNSFGGNSFGAIKNINDTLWLTGPNYKIFNYKNGQLKVRRKIYGYTRKICSGENDEILFPTNFGLFKLTNGKEERISKTKNISLANTFCSWNENDTVYLGTEGGVAKVENGEIVSTNFRGLKISNPIYCFLKTKSGDIFLGTDNGIYIITSNNKLIHYTEQHGLIGVEINRGALVEAADGKVWIGNNKSLSIYNPLQLSCNKEVFPLIIHSIKIDDQSRTHPWIDLELPSNVYNTSFIFSNVSINKEEIEYRYRLLGYEEQWQYLNTPNLREISYRKIPSGKYQLEIQYQLFGESWSESTISSAFSVDAPYYYQWWFFVFLAFLIGAIGYFINQGISHYKLSSKLSILVRSKVKEVEENEAKLKLALENSRLGVWSYDLIKGQSEYTQEVYNFLDMPANSPSLNRENYLFRFHPDDADRVHNTLKESMQNGQPYDVEFRSLQSNGSYKWLHGKGRCSFNEKGEPYKLTGTVSDISRRKNFEAERERLINDLKRANEELDRFVYSVSHDLSAPIKSIKGLINLTRIAKNEEEIKTYIELIETSVEKQDKFIKEIMDYAYNARKDISIENVNVYQITKDVIEGLAFSDDAQRESIHILIEPTTSIVCDKLRLRIILNNLISNAIKFRKQIRYHEHKVEVSFIQTDEGFSLSVSDTGMGIDQPSLDKIFNMFYRATDTVSGSGLGLYIAKDAAEKMGYQLKVVSTIGLGSTFSIVGNKESNS